MSVVPLPKAAWCTVMVWATWRNRINSSRSSPWVSALGGGFVAMDRGQPLKTLTPNLKHRTLANRRSTRPGLPLRHRGGIQLAIDNSGWRDPGVLLGQEAGFDRLLQSDVVDCETHLTRPSHGSCRRHVGGFSLSLGIPPLDACGVWYGRVCRWAQAQAATRAVGCLRSRRSGKVPTGPSPRGLRRQ